MKKYFRAYLRHIRKQSDHSKRVHAFSISGIITVLIAVIWLHVNYGFWSNEEISAYPKDQKYEERDLGSKEVKSTTSEQLVSPGAVFSNFMDDFRKRMNEVPLDFKEVINDKETFERQE
jgi:hypothetical protein